jgi:predicted amidohydrolase
MSAAGAPGGVFKAACVQTCADREFAPNIRAVGDLVRRARDQGADFIATPEVVGMLEPKKALHLEKAREEAGHPVLVAFCDLARETGAWLLVGSLAIKLDESTLANRSFVIDPNGAVAARYDKMHMFDVDLGNGERYRESSLYRPGDETVLAALPWGLLGMTICYDIRFPYLYRMLAQAGADFLTAPSAFAVPTGRAHWHVLLRSRAIETGCYVIAPAQVGEHAEGRRSYGHSLIVSPWGEVLADAGGDETGVVVAEIDPSKVAEARRMVPSLRHDRPVAAPAVPPRPATASRDAAE